MRRREFMTVFSSAASVPLGARAEQRPLPLIAFLTPRTFTANIDAFRRGLRELGYVEGQNIALEVRSAEGDYRRLPLLAAELVSRLRHINGCGENPVVVSGKHGQRAPRSAVV